MACNELPMPMDSEDPLKDHQDSPQVGLQTHAASDTIEVEQVDPEEFAFLEGATHLAALQTELDDVKAALARTRNGGQYTPLRLFRRGRDNVISVTDTVMGLWCEVQVEYKYLHPHMKKTAEWTKLAEKGTPVQLRTVSMKQGSAVHLKKELEVRERVQVEMLTKEDRWAVTLTNTYLQLASIKSGAVEREIAVFGELFATGILINGIIDQLQYSQETGELTLLDYKTRQRNCLPSPEQKKGNALQLMIYKCLLDHLTCGATPFSLLNKHLGLDFRTPLSKGPVEYIKQCGLESLLAGEMTFGAVAECVSRLILGLGLPLVTTLVLQYEYKSTGDVIGVEGVDYDEEWMKEQLESCLSFWRGQRSARGVDIEEAWKCDVCQFRDICVWRIHRKLERSPAAMIQPNAT